MSAAQRSTSEALPCGFTELLLGTSGAAARARASPARAAVGSPGGALVTHTGSPAQQRASRRGSSASGTPSSDSSSSAVQRQLAVGMLSPEQARWRPLPPASPAASAAPPGVRVPTAVARVLHEWAALKDACMDLAGEERQAAETAWVSQGWGRWPSLGPTTTTHSLRLLSMRIAAFPAHLNPHWSLLTAPARLPPPSAASQSNTRQLVGPNCLLVGVLPKLELLMPGARRMPEPAGALLFCAGVVLPGQGASAQQALLGGERQALRLVVYCPKTAQLAQCRDRVQASERCLYRHPRFDQWAWDSR